MQPSAVSQITASPLWILPDRKKLMPLALGAAVFTIAFLSIVLTRGTRAATLLLDNTPFSHFPYPFTIQNVMHVFFFIGLGELFVRWRVAERELGFAHQGLLPEDQETVLTVRDLGAIRRKISGKFDNENGSLPSLIDLSILQFQGRRSVDQTVAVMQSSLELLQHRVDMRYGLIRFIAWLIPTLGFIGTVLGLGGSLASVPAQGEVKMYDVAQKMAVGFDCTMVALSQSAVLVFLLHLVQEKEETSVNLAGTYTLRNLINRLYAGSK
ncbi:MAG: MotA/TolQ/ExbB proton channel family protein [Bryobacteraceae bacterium]